MSSPHPLRLSGKRAQFVDAYIRKSETQKASEADKKKATAERKLAKQAYKNSLALAHKLIDERAIMEMEAEKYAAFVKRLATVKARHEPLAKLKDAAQAKLRFVAATEEVNELSKEVAQALKARTPESRDQLIEWNAGSHARRELRAGAQHAIEMLTMKQVDGATPAASNALKQAESVLENLAMADKHASDGNFKYAGSSVRTATAAHTQVDAHLAALVPAPGSLCSQWQNHAVRDKIARLVETENFDGAANSNLVKVLRGLLDVVQSGQCKRAVDMALAPVAAFNAAEQKYEGARQTYLAFGDVSTILKQDSELMASMRLDLLTVDSKTANEAYGFSTGGNEYLRARQCYAEGQYLRAVKNFQMAKAEVARIRAIWQKHAGSAVKEGFVQRADPAEVAIAQGIGESTYLDKLSLAEVIVRHNRFDPYTDPSLRSPMKKEEVAAVYGYTTQDYAVINPMMRGRKPDNIEAQAWPKKQAEFAQYAKSLAAGLAKLPGYTGTVFRGADMPAAVIEQLVSKRSLTDVAFASSSYSHGFAGPHQFLIHAKGRGGKDVSNFSIYKDSEGEVLFMPGTRFKVTQIIRKDANPPGQKPHPNLYEGDIYFVLEED